MDFASLSRLAQTNLWIGGRPGARLGGGTVLRYVNEEQWRIREQKGFLAVRREFLAGLAKSQPEVRRRLVCVVSVWTTCWTAAMAFGRPCGVVVLWWSHMSAVVAPYGCCGGATWDIGLSRRI
jgi:hypothetical protein